MKKLYANFNMLLRKFNKCSYDIQCMLFKSYCANLYCCQFWHSACKTTMNKLRIAYYNSLRRLLNIPKYNSASEMFVCLNIPSFGELLRRKSIFNFFTRLNCNNNSRSNIHSMTIYYVTANSNKISLLIYWGLSDYSVLFLCVLTVFIQVYINIGDQQCLMLLLFLLIMFYVCYLVLCTCVYFTYGPGA